MAFYKTNKKIQGSLIYLARPDTFFAMVGLRVDPGAAQVKGRPFMAIRAL